MFVARLPIIAASCLCLALAAVFAWQLSPYVIYFINGETTQAVEVNPKQTIQHTPEATQRDYPIASFKLFGDASAPVKKEVIVDEKLPETTLRLRLTGVMAGKDNQQAGALIEGPDRQTKSYRIDDEVPGGAILKQVYPDRVVLERSGRLENLIFEETRPIGIEFQAPDVEERDEDEVAYAPTPSHSAQSGSLENFNQQQTQQIKDRLSKLRSRLQNNSL